MREVDPVEVVDKGGDDRAYLALLSPETREFLEELYALARSTSREPEGEA